MEYNDFKGEKLSRLGFGAMRLPLNEDKSIDEKTSAELIDLAMANGVNYYDTAFSYLNGNSEVFLGKTLPKYPRESYNLATKFPGHEIADSYNPQKTFEEQLRKCKTEYFDFYLMHNVYEKSIQVYEDSRWGIVDYFIKQKELGRIRHLGFSSHGGIDNIRRFLNRFGSVMEFCQLQINYLDWTLQGAADKYTLLSEQGIPVWVMEPVRGGKLAKLPDNAENKLKELRPDASIASWAFRWLKKLPNVKMILSGMSSKEQVLDNIRTFSSGDDLSNLEMDTLASIAEDLKNTVPCTACRYCCKGCPQQLDIPALMQVYNDICFTPSMVTAFILGSIPADKRSDACIACGKCTRVCPQNINIPQIMKALTEKAKTLPDWEEICRERLKMAQQNQGK